MGAGVAIALCHSIVRPAHAAIPFTSTDTPLAYFFLKQATKRHIKHKNELEGELEYGSEISIQNISFMLYVPFCG
jgi:hypothetical protein